MTTINILFNRFTGIYPFIETHVPMFDRIELLQNGFAVLRSSQLWFLAHMNILSFS